MHSEAALPAPTTHPRVVHFVPAFSALSETFIYDYVVELQRQGVRGEVVTLARTDRAERPFSPVSRVRTPGRWHPERLLRKGLSYAAPAERRVGYLWPVWRRRLAAILRASRPDLVHAHYGPAGAIVAPVAAELGIPLVVSFHGFDAYRLPRTSYWREAYAGLFRRARAVTVVSREMAGRLRELGAPEERIHRVHVGKRLADYPYRDPTAPPRRWISVGRLTHKKGHLDLLRAFAGLAERHPELRLQIVGEGELEGEIRRAIGALRLERRVELLGPRPHAEVRALMAQADAFVLCSRSSPDGDREGIPTVLMEAQALGLPCVATRHSGIPEGIPERNHRYLAPEGDVARIAECIEALTRRSLPELQAISRAGRTLVEEEFRLEREVEKLRGIYQTMLDADATC